MRSFMPERLLTHEVRNPLDQVVGRFASAREAFTYVGGRKGLRVLAVRDDFGRVVPGTTVADFVMERSVGR